MRHALKNCDLEKAAKVHPALMQADSNKLSVFWVNLFRPVEILFRSLVCFVLSLYMAL